MIQRYLVVLAPVKYSAEKKFTWQRGERRGGLYPWSMLCPGYQDGLNPSDLRAAHVCALCEQYPCDNFELSFEPRVLRGLYAACSGILGYLLELLNRPTCDFMYSCHESPRFFNPRLRRVSSEELNIHQSPLSVLQRNRLNLCLPATPLCLSTR